MCTSTTRNLEVRCDNEINLENYHNTTRTRFQCPWIVLVLEKQKITHILDSKRTAESEPCERAQTAINLKKSGHNQKNIELQGSETFFSIFDGNTPLLVNYYPRNLELRRGLEHHPPIVKLQWFTRGYYALSEVGNDILVTDLRMGSAPHYVFRFKVGEAGNPHSQPVKAERLETTRDWHQLISIWNRIWTPRP